ncbi:hypothetical protein ACGFZU_34915 [Streptomyces tendae]|uniref:hypothetical protein n=1 Tax=Streptomyces tendae TaxID=1932 RepID=UPI0037115450
MTLPQRSPALVQIAPVGTPPDAGPHVWMDVGFTDDFSMDYVDEGPEFILPAPLTASTTVDVDMSHLSWDDLLSQLRAIYAPRPACFDTRERIEEDLRRRRITRMLQAALHSYRTSVLPAPAPSLISLSLS